MRVALLSLTLFCLPAFGQAGAIAKKIDEAESALDEWDLVRAKALASEVHSALPDIPPVQALLGRIKFHEGDYQGAVAHLERASEAGQVHPLLPLAKSTLDETRDYVTFESEHFKLRVPPGKDEVLKETALSGLEKAFDEITRAYDFVPKHKINVDVLHDTRGLAAVSLLTRKEIETSGTIALCKYNRLMITSPKALARGYAWLDTLSHEFLHLVISEKSKNTVPIWLHEGLAKYSESLWRGEAGLALGAASENLLAKAVKKNKLITFEQMHPSMAKLPSQEDTALAFAEVFTVIEFLHKKKGGWAATNKLLENLAVGKDMDDALSAAVSMDLAKMQRAWRRYLKKRAFKLVPGAKAKKLKFVKNARSRAGGEDDDEAEAAIAEAKTREGRRYVRLGNLLRQRRRMKAAAVEYEKASAQIGNLSPALHNRLAGIYTDLGDTERAKKLLDKTLAVFPDDPQTNVLMGRVFMRDEKFEDAERHYRRATWENPFNPEIWAAIKVIGDKTSKSEKSDEALRNLKLLSRHAKKTKPEPEGSRGSVSVDSQPWGQLYVDGERVYMSTPVTDLSLPVGERAVRVEDPVSGKVGFARVTVEDGKAARVFVELKAYDAAGLEAAIEKERAFLAPEKKAEKTPGAE